MSLSHAEILASYAVVSYRTACAILGGDDEPVGKAKIRRLIRAGILVSPHKGKITTASLRAHLEAPGDQSDREVQGAKAVASTSRVLIGLSSVSNRQRKADPGLGGGASPGEPTHLDRWPRGLSPRVPRV